MASHVQTVTRTVVTRRARDIDPKIAGVFAVAAATIGVVLVAVLAIRALGGTVDVAAVVGPILPVLVAAGVGYIRRSSHGELIDDGIQEAGDLATELAPALEAAAPAAAPEIEEIADGVQWVAKAVDQPAPTA